MILKPNRTSRKSGLMLLDVMVYIGLLVFVLALIAVVFEKAYRQSAQLQRNVSDIERAMKAGERWRDDVRAATDRPRLEKIEGYDFFMIPMGTNEVAYSLQSNVLFRFTSTNGAAERALTQVKSAQMIEEKRSHAAGWRWELELERRQKSGQVRPLFTFMAVPGKQ